MDSEKVLTVFLGSRVSVCATARSSQSGCSGVAIQLRIWVAPGLSIMARSLRPFTNTETPVPALQILNIGQST